jgi:ComF family protein
MRLAINGRARSVIELIPHGRFLIPGIANALATALLAPACAVCDAVLNDPLGGCVCTTCWGAVRPITPPVCDGCGVPLARDNPSGKPNTKPLCLECCHSIRVVDRARAIGEYEGTLREIIQALKYGGRRSLAGPVAARMRSRGVELLQDADCVTPVPLHWRREYQRGFNQARELARHLNAPLLELVARRRHTQAQVELPAEQRRANVESAFMIRRQPLRQRRSIQGLKVVLVDDVCTTGATLEECARVLKEAGASAVYALTAARVITRHGVRSNP